MSTFVKKNLACSLRHMLEHYEFEDSSINSFLSYLIRAFKENAYNENQVNLNHFNNTGQVGYSHYLLLSDIDSMKISTELSVITMYKISLA